MSCPNCKEELQEQITDGQTIWHCKNCGGTFFEENGINRISISTAEKLSQDKQSEEILSEAKLCPRDHTPLTVINHSEAVPTTVTLLECATCHGVFTYPDDLVRFKQAQLAKIQYFKIWNIPLPGLKSVIVLSVALFASAFLLSTFFNQQLTPTQAEDVVKNVHISQSNRYLFISFRTTIPVMSRIVFTNTATGVRVEKQMQTNLSTLHYLTVTEFPAQTVSYQIILRSKSGEEFKTKETPLKLQ